MVHDSTRRYMILPSSTFLEVVMNKSPRPRRTWCCSTPVAKSWVVYGCQSACPGGDGQRIATAGHGLAKKHTTSLLISCVANGKSTQEIVVTHSEIFHRIRDLSQFPRWRIQKCCTTSYIHVAVGEHFWLRLFCTVCFLWLWFVYIYYCRASHTGDALEVGGIRGCQAEAFVLAAQVWTGLVQ